MRLYVNGVTHDVAAPPHATLLTVLRDALHLTGTKLVCDRGECGACTVLLDEVPVYACLTLAVACQEARVTTIEGIAGDDLHPLQRAFIAHDAAQCGYCTPGQILAGIALLSRTPRPSDHDIAVAMSGNLCRCGTYPRIAAAIRTASETMRARAEGSDAAR